MLKLKITKERTGSEDTENDLRGLSHDQLIQNTNPYAFMAVKSFDKDVLTKVAEIFQIKINQTEKNEWILVLQNKSDNFKSDAITLFAASLAISKLDPNCKMFLGVSQLLKALLKQSEKVQKDLSLGERLEIADCDYTSGVLSLSPVVQITLKQAGVHCITSDKNRILDLNQVEELSGRFTSSVQKSKLNKVG